MTLRETLETYVVKQKAEIAQRIETDEVINADSYHNVSLYKEIERIERVVNKNANL